MSQCCAGSNVGMWRHRVFESKGSAEPRRDADRPMSNATAVGVRRRLVGDEGVSKRRVEGW